ncbi:MAG TPA: hypothetical protein VGL42_15055 [Opitutaceae bacterium]|jgi:ankyrin repeat protein
MSKVLPTRASLRQLQVQAKELAAELKSGDARAIARFAQATGRTRPSTAKVHDAQWAIAREYGFENWAALKAEAQARERKAIEPLREKLRQAVESGDTPALRALVTEHPALKSELKGPLFSFGAPAVMRAIQKKDLPMVDALIAVGADLNQRSHWEPGGFGALDHADDELAAQLIARGAKVDIHAAAHLGDVRRVREILAAKPEQVNARGGDGGTPLHFARNLETASLLLERGAGVQIRDLDHGSTAAMWQVRNREVLYRLIEAGSPIDIYMACVHGDRELAERALREDPDCLGSFISHQRGHGKFAPDSGGNYYNWQIGHAARPIPTAVKFGHRELSRFLLERAKPADRLVALCFLDDREALNRLLQEHPALTSSLDAAGARALPDAIHFGDFPAAKRMIEVGFPVTGHGVEGGTPLHVASWMGNVDLVAALIRKGAPVDDRNNVYQGTPLEWACHGSLNRAPGPDTDFAATATTLIDSGGSVPEVENGRASTAILEVLRKGKQSS